MIRGARKVLDGTQRRAGKLRRPLSWARGKADKLVLNRLEDQVLGWMTEPEKVQRLQKGLAYVTQMGMERGFEADPAAAQLYRFVAWLEEHHGREEVLLRVVQHAAATQAALLSVLQPLLIAFQQPRGSAGQEEAARRFHEMRDEVGTHLLDLLCQLAALETGEPPPAGKEARVAFFEEAGLPDEYRTLAAMAAGMPGAFESAAARVRDSASEGPQRSGLARFVPSFDDPHLRFLSLSHLFFVQSYLARNLIELLPDLLDPDAAAVDLSELTDRE